MNVTGILKRLGRMGDYSILGSTISGIGGERDGDQFGYSVAMNSDGDRVVIGGPFNDGPSLSATDNRGHVRVYSLSGSTWTQLGADIDGNTSSTPLLFGHSVSINSAGDRIVIGAPGNTNTATGYTKVYSLSGSTWIQLGQTINAEFVRDRSGYSVSMNSAGNRIAIGGPFNTSSGSTTPRYGHVRVYSLNGSTWTQLGADIDGEGISDNAGTSVSLNSAGDRVAIGAPFNDANTNITDRNYGHVRVFSLISGSWVKLGQDIDGELVSQSGISVSMNSAGNRVAIGANNYYTVDGWVGQVRVYSWDGTSWEKIGNDMNGQFSLAQFGYSVSINSAGDRVAIGSYFKDITGENTGCVEIYSWNGTSWSKSTFDINGENIGEQLGWCVSLNSAGNRVAIGSNANRHLRGRVQIFSLNEAT